MKRPVEILTKRKKTRMNPRQISTLFLPLLLLLFPADLVIRYSERPMETKCRDEQGRERRKKKIPQE